MQEAAVSRLGDVWLCGGHRLICGDARDPAAYVALMRGEEARKGLSQEELAFQADMHRTYVSGIERGKRNPTVTVLERLAKPLGTTARERLG